jgi:hypothetical protein
LVADHISIHTHVTLDKIYNKQGLLSTNSSATAARLLFFENNSSSYVINWLFTNSGNRRWVDASNATFADIGGKILAPGTAWFTHPRGTSTYNLLIGGQVRAHKFANRIPVGSQFVSTGYPINASPTMLSMLPPINSFSSNRRSTQADQLQSWNADYTLGSNGFTSHYLYASGALLQWVSMANATFANLNSTPFFRVSRGVVIKSYAGTPNWISNVPWNP